MKCILSSYTTVGTCIHIYKNPERRLMTVFVPGQWQDSCWKGEDMALWMLVGCRTESAISSWHKGRCSAAQFQLSSKVRKTEGPSSIKVVFCCGFCFLVCFGGGLCCGVFCFVFCFVFYTVLTLCSILSKKSQTPWCSLCERVTFQLISEFLMFASS